MAIIKCPECGHQISDKAPICPNCGVEIAGKIIRCPNCGEVYFANEEMCPNCHRPTKSNTTSSHTPSIPKAPTDTTDVPFTTSEDCVLPPSHPENTKDHSASSGQDSSKGSMPPGNHSGNGSYPKGKKKRNYIPLIVGIIIAIVALGIMYHFYSTAKNDKEEQDYEIVMKSSDPTVLQSYLDTYQDAPEAHRDSVQNHLMKIKQNNQEWTNAIMRGSKGALEDYLQNYPHSIHAAEARNKIDSLDWRDAHNENTPESYQEYLKAHPQGAFADLAQEGMKEVQQKELQPEEKQMISALFRTFFQSINSKNESQAANQAENVMSSFLGKTNATKEDVASFIHKIWKNNITNMNWKINNDYNIKKHNVGDNRYVYQVQFSVRQNVSSTDASQPTQSQYRINATVSPNNKISSFNMVRIIL